jgi:hypothetical protein
LKTAKTIGIIFVVAIGILAVQKASGSVAYLEKVGPPPLRFELVAANNTLFMAELALPKPKTIVPPPMPTAPTNSASSETEIAAGGGVMGMYGAGNGGQFFGGAAKNAGGQRHSASDMLSVMPQMINEYFKPSREGVPDSDSFQQGQSIFVPAELGFVPPTTGSRAIYQSK